MNIYKFDVPATSGDMPRDFFAFARYVWRKNPGLWVLITVLDIVHYTRFPLSFVLLGKIIDILQASKIENGIPAAVIHYLIAVFCILLFGESAHAWLTQIFVHWRPKLRSAIRLDFMNYAMGHSHTYFQDHFAGALARKISELSEGTIRLQDIQRNQIFFAMINMVTRVIIAFTIHYIYAFFLIFFIASVILPVVIRISKIRARSLAYAHQRSHMTGIIVDTMTNMHAVKSFAAIEHEKSFHADQSAVEFKLATKLMRSMAQIENLRRASLVMLGAGMMTLAVYGWSQGWITVGQASVLSTLAFTLAGATWMLGGGIVQCVDEIGNMGDALRTIAPAHQIRDAEDARALSVTDAAITYSHVRFAYGGNTVFPDMDVTIKGGEKIALIGPSGAGKSTFVNLLLRLFEISDGSIMIDGQDIRTLKQDSLREHIAVIPQDIALFHRSLMENIRYGRREATDAEVMEAARRAHAHDFITQLPLGYDTLVGERGIKLSGGQRQRIAIARAILKNAPILILDEATSALDSESERLIQQALAELMAGKTVIAIAHRLSTIARMDRILVFDQGRIVEQGNHDSLLSQQGLYARLWAMQSGGFLRDNMDEMGRDLT